MSMGRAEIAKVRGSLIGLLAIVNVVMTVVACQRSWVDDGFAPPAPTRPSPTPSTTFTSSKGSQCVDPNGFGSRGCFRCEPKTNDELLNACTPSKFEPFDNKLRIVGFDEDDPRPKLPSPSPPSLPPFDPGDAGSEPALPPAPPCSLASHVNPVFVLGATGFPMDTLAKAMGNLATIFYAEKGS